MNTIEQNIQRIIDQEIYCNASTFVADMQATDLSEQLPATFESLIECSVKDDYETPVIEALRDITPAGLLDVCECFGFTLYDKAHPYNTDPESVIDEHNIDSVEHDTPDRDRLIKDMEKDGADWQEIADHLDIEPHTEEALQHWLVSDWLAELLEEVGALVAVDVMGFNIWGRTECGQSLTMDSDLKRAAVRVEERLKEIN